MRIRTSLQPAPGAAAVDAKPAAQLRLYIARSTPNSARAEKNLAAAIKEIDAGLDNLAVDVIDVFTSPKCAITDGVIVTPTLLGLQAAGRLTMIGDLADTEKLKLLLQTLLDGAAA
jgi:circadian clock protein KaiB